MNQIQRNQTMSVTSAVQDLSGRVIGLVISKNYINRIVHDKTTFVASVVVDLLGYKMWSNIWNLHTGSKGSKSVRYSKNTILSYEADCGEVIVPLVAHRTCLVVEEENVYDEPPRSLRSKVTRQTDILDLTAIQGKVTGQTDILDLTATDCCLEPALSSMESVKRVRRPPQSLGSSLAMLADNPRFALKHARSKPQTLRSSNPEDPSNISPSAILQAASNSSPPKSPERVTRKLSMEARFPKSKRAKPQTSTPERFPQAPELHRTAPEESVIVSLSSDSEPQASTPKLLCSKNIKFHFFLANEQHGAILKSLEKCNTMSSFFDEAQEAWDASGEEQHQARMTAVKVIIEDVSRPMFILWRDQEGYEGMMDAIQEQAAGRPKSLNVEIRCHFKRG